MRFSVFIILKIIDESKLNNIICSPCNPSFIVIFFIFPAILAFSPWTFSKFPMVVVSISVMTTNIALDEVHLRLELTYLEIFLFQLGHLELMLVLQLVDFLWLPVELLSLSTESFRLRGDQTKDVR